MLRSICRLLFLGTALAATPASADLAHDLGIGDGRVHFSCEAREGIHGSTHNVVINGDIVVGMDDEFDGLVHITVDLDDGRVVDLETRVGGKPKGRERQAHDLGEYPADDVATYLLDLVGKVSDPDVAEDAVVGAALADAVVWPRLADLARDRDLHADVREAAIFWLGMQAGAKVERDLVAIVDDDDEDVEIREHAVFALSQALEHDTDRAVTTLGGIATRNLHPQVRRSALFWLAQHDDPRVVDLFEEILLD